MPTSKALSVPAILAIGFAVAPALAQRGANAPAAALSAERSVPAETTAAAYKNPSWKAPRTSCFSSLQAIGIDTGRPARARTE